MPLRYVLRKKYYVAHKYLKKGRIIFYSLIFIYIYTERERETHTHTYICVYVLRKRKNKY